MRKLSIKDFKYYDKRIEIASCDTKKLYAVLILTENRIVYNIAKTGSNEIDVFNTLNEAIKEYNRLN